MSRQGAFRLELCQEISLPCYLVTLASNPRGFAPSTFLLHCHVGEIARKSDSSVINALGSGFQVCTEPEIPRQRGIYEAGIICDEAGWQSLLLENFRLLLIPAPKRRPISQRTAAGLNTASSQLDSETYAECSTFGAYFLPSCTF